MKLIGTDGDLSVSFINSKQNRNGRTGYDFTLEEYEEYTAKLLESAEGEGELKDLSEKELAAVFGGLTGKHKIQAVLMYGVPRAIWDL